MTRFRKISNALLGAFMILLGLALMISAKPDDLGIVAFIICISMTVSGINSLVYYFRMARHMVGGRTTLYRGIIFLEVGAVSAAFIENPGAVVILYLALIHLAYGAIDVLRGNEARQVGSPHWKLTIASGVTNILIAAAIFVTGILIDRVDITVMVYGACIIYSGILRMIKAFRRTAIVYIQ